MARATRIPPIAGFSWKRRIGIFTSVFGGLWLFLKPLDTFGVATGLFDSLGLWGYLTLLGISIVSAIAAEIAHRGRQAGSIDWVTFVMLWSPDGSRHGVQAPADIQSAHFVSAFWDYILRTSSGAGWEERRRIYDWTLILYRDGEHVEIGRNQTLREGGVQEGSQCAVRGIIKPEHRFTVVHVPDVWEPDQRQADLPQGCRQRLTPLAPT